MLKFSLAHNGRVKEASGAWADKTEWINVVVFGTRAEQLGGRLAKGSRIYVSGRCESKPYISRKDEQPQAGLSPPADLHGI
jgi:single-strand DNA-binding protein